MELELLPLESRGMFVVFDESNTLLYRSLMEETCEDAIARARESEFYDPTYAFFDRSNLTRPLLLARLITSLVLAVFAIIAPPDLCCVRGRCCMLL